tara:strand:- start:1075 stop:1878 length:804 start_codon:yes stop_codon:yes gene_type:complete
MTKTEEFAKEVRLNAIKMVSNGNSSHIGSILSCADILAVLYAEVLEFDVTDPKSKSRDRFILSKGHAGAGVYASLALSGFFEVDVLVNHYKNGSIFSGHVSHKEVPGVELSTGSLGHGLGVGCGMAYEAKLKNKKHRVFVLLSDGECDEGSNWEAFLFAGHHRLSNLVAIVDYNKLQSLKSIEETLGLEPFIEKLNAFGWNTIEINGHNHNEILNALNFRNDDKPTFVLANTIKGKGVSFMENQVLWHYRSPQGEEYEKAIKEIEDA